MAAFSLYLLWLTMPGGFAQAGINSGVFYSGKEGLEPLSTLPTARDPSGASVGTIRKRVNEVVASSRSVGGYQRLSPTPI